MTTKPDKTPSILWADDDADDLMIVREVLERKGPEYNVVEVFNGREVLQYLDALQQPAEYPCLIVLDLNMPVLNGKQTLAQLKEKRKYDAIPVVVFTTSSSGKDKSYCESYGVEMYTKPSSLAELEEVIMKILDHCNKSVQCTAHS